MVAMLSGMPDKRITMNTVRIAKNEGIIVISLAEGLRNTSRNAQKMTEAVMTKLSVSVGSSRAVMAEDSAPFPTT